MVSVRMPRRPTPESPPSSRMLSRPSSGNAVDRVVVVVGGGWSSSRSRPAARIGRRGRRGHVFQGDLAGVLIEVVGQEVAGQQDALADVEVGIAGGQQQEDQPADGRQPGRRAAPHRFGGEEGVGRGEGAEAEQGDVGDDEEDQPARGEGQGGFQEPVAEVGGGQPPHRGHRGRRGDPQEHPAAPLPPQVEVPGAGQRGPTAPPPRRGWAGGAPRRGAPGVVGRASRQITPGVGESRRIRLTPGSLGDRGAWWASGVAPGAPPRSLGCPQDPPGDMGGIMRTKWTWLALVAVLALLAAACGDDAQETTTTAATTTTAQETTTTSGNPTTTTTVVETTTTAPAEPLVIGMILVGPQNDHGWSQAHYEAGLYLQEQLGAELIVLDKVNTADRPETTVDQVVTQMIGQGADLIFATSDDMKDGILLGAEQHPDVPMIWSSGDSAWAEAGEAYRARPHQPGQHHGAHGVRQDDRRLRRRPDHRDRPARLPRPADQRRDPPPGQLGLPGRQVLLDENYRGKRSRRPRASRSTGSASGSTSPG